MQLLEQCCCYGVFPTVVSQPGFSSHSQASLESYNICIQTGCRWLKHKCYLAIRFAWSVSQSLQNLRNMVEVSAIAADIAATLPHMLAPEHICQKVMFLDTLWNSPFDKEIAYHAGLPIACKRIKTPFWLSARFTQTRWSCREPTWWPRQCIGFLIDRSSSAYKQT